jgi:hypothetical protein
VIGLLSNPELVRCCRAQLRPGRMVALGGICAALSLATGFAMAYGFYRRPREWGMPLLQLALVFQGLALCLGGGLACLQSISREKEMNTFDFQRVTRLTPLELAVGKLFGAPALMYFVVLCLLPAALTGAWAGRARPSFVLASYLVILLGSIATHAFALMISLFIERGTAPAGVLLLLVLAGFLSFPDFGTFAVGPLTPFFVASLVEETSWAVAPAEAAVGQLRLVDVFFGQRVHHVWALVVICLTFTAWFLLGVARNIKRDPACYELFTPGQSLGLVLYFNLLMIGFFQRRQYTADQSASLMLGINLTFFMALGLILLRNRERVRRRLRQRGAALGWGDALWPAPYLLAGVLLVGGLVIAMASWQHVWKGQLALAPALYRLGFVALWVTRDVLYLQWVCLTRIRRPLTMGVLYLVVFYLCAGVLVGALDLEKAPYLPFSSLFVPALVFAVDSDVWKSYSLLLLFSLSIQVVVIGLFACLQRQKLLELSAHPPTPAPAPATAD